MTIRDDGTTERLIAGCCTVCYAPAKDMYRRAVDDELMPHCGRFACLERLRSDDRPRQEDQQ